jgi:hypothetical protein
LQESVQKTLSNASRSHQQHVIEAWPVHLESLYWSL